MKTKIKIGKVWIEHRTDENPDTSYLGENSNTLGEDAIERPERGRGEYRYFNPAQHLSLDEWDGVSDIDVLKAYGKHVRAGHQEASRETMIEELNHFYQRLDFERMESLSRGDWHYLGIIAKCEVLVPVPGNPGSFMIQTIHSGGLWGIESDSEASYLASVGKEELGNLRAQLLALGLGNRAITHAFKTVQTVNK